MTSDFLGQEPGNTFWSMLVIGGQIFRFVSVAVTKADMHCSMNRAGSVFLLSRLHTMVRCQMTF